MFYQWPQGRIVRICVMVLGALIAADMGYNGAYAAFATYGGDAAGSGATRQLILGITYGVLALASLLTGLIAAGPHQKAVQFLIEVQDEMTKVTWPKGGELWRSTLVVGVAITIIAGLVWLSDLALISGLNYIQK
ncbi:MAG TPA: preprotein translocase subunit SecE [Planctomycetes bacterium]|nr:preprotein translocase subunit SecE [Planctomycetota bacterium]